MLDTRSDFAHYEPSYRLLLEARESWDYVVGDELIYCFNSGKVAFDSFVGVPKDYFEGLAWVEVHLTFHAEGETHYAIIIERDDHRLRDSVREFKIKDGSVDGNSPMLINIAEFIQPPEQIPSNGYFIPSVVRLKRLNDGFCSCGYSSGTTVEVGDIGLFENRELRTLGVRSRSNRGQQPHQIIKRSAQAVENLSGDNRQPGRRVSDLNLNFIQSVFKIVLTEKLIGIGIVEGFQFALQGFKVFLRPRCLEIGVSKVHRERISHEESQKASDGTLSAKLL